MLDNNEERFEKNGDSRNASPQKAAVYKEGRIANIMKALERNRT
jgi:hypothetical protein